MAQKQEFKNTRATREEILDFYRLMERCYESLSFLYQRHDFKARHVLAYKQKMDFRKDCFFYKKDYLQWIEYVFLDLTCEYGSSVMRWAVTTVIFMFLMSLAYMVIDSSVPEVNRMIPEGAHWFDYFYFSTIMLTTVGLGDITPVTTLGKVLASGEAFFGFLMLGVFLGMMNKKL